MKKTIVITGMTSGIGLAVFKHLLSQGHHVIGIARNPKRLEDVKNSLDAKCQDAFRLYQADLAILSDIDAVSEQIHKDYPNGIDVLINNAALVPRHKIMTVDQYETQFQVNHLAVVKLTYLLFDLLKKKKGTIITTSSNAHRIAKYNPKKVEDEKRYFSFRTYGRTKLFNIYFTDAFNAYVGPQHDVYAYAVHPGLVKTEIGTKGTTPLYAFVWRIYTRRGITPEEAVLSYDYLVNQKTRDESYSYYYRAKKEPKSKVAQNHVNRDDLWLKTLKILNIDTWS